MNSIDTNAMQRWSYCLIWYIFNTAFFNNRRFLRSEALKLAPVYWNASNPLFKQSVNGRDIEVMLWDEIDFVCPYYSSATESNLQEYYVVYQVSAKDYEQCVVSSSSKSLLRCNTPDVWKRYTLIFEPYQSIPNSPEFKPGETYYYITTSTGSEGGQENQHLGACWKKNMNLVIHVCCASSGSSTVTMTQNRTPSNKTVPMTITSVTDSLQTRNSSTTTVIPSSSVSSTITRPSTQSSTWSSSPAGSTKKSTSDKNVSKQSFTSSTTKQRCNTYLITAVLVMQNLLMVLVSFR